MQTAITTFTVGLKALIMNDKQQFLIIQRAKNITKGGLYDLPGGRMHLGETLRTALTREVKEEVGLTLEKIFNPICITTFVRDVDKSNQIVRVLFPCLASGKIELDSLEVSDYLWINQQDASNYQFPDENFLDALTRIKPSDFKNADTLGKGALIDSLDFLE